MVVFFFIFSIHEVVLIQFSTSPGVATLSIPKQLFEFSIAQNKLNYSTHLLPFRLAFLVKDGPCRGGVISSTAKTAENKYHSMLSWFCTTAHQVNHAQPNAEKKHKTFPAAYLRPFLPISWILQHSIRFSKSN